MTKRTIEQQINQANQRLSGLKARQKKLEARQQMIVGKIILQLAKEDTYSADTLLTLLTQAELKPAEERDLAPVINALTQLKDKP